MKLYRVSMVHDAKTREVLNSEAYVFSPDTIRAGSLFTAVHVGLGLRNFGYRIGPVSPDEFEPQKRKRLKNALSRNLSGIGRYDEKRGWQIIPSGGRIEDLVFLKNRR
ncbi:hypothetical protein ACSMXM_03880 [Pacificimonas sp. ICDLI1SI03]